MIFQLICLNRRVRWKLDLRHTVVMVVADHHGINLRYLAHGTRCLGIPQGTDPLGRTASLRENGIQEDPDPSQTRLLWRIFEQETCMA